MDQESWLGGLVEDVARFWWVFVVTGIIWLIISLVVLRFTTTSVTTVGILIGVVFAFAAITEFMVVGVTTGGWRVVHVILAILFLLTAIWGFANPKDAFWALASVLGFVLVERFACIVPGQPIDEVANFASPVIERPYGGQSFPWHTRQAKRSHRYKGGL